jgi:hypothetical protein
LSPAKLTAFGSEWVPCRNFPYLSQTHWIHVLQIVLLFCITNFLLSVANSRTFLYNYFHPFQCATFIILSSRDHLPEVPGHNRLWCRAQELVYVAQVSLVTDQQGHASVTSS